MATRSGLDYLRNLLRDKVISGGDMALLLGLSGLTELGQNVVRMNQGEIAQKLGHTHAYLRNRMKRLRDQNLVRNISEPKKGRYWTVLNPQVLTSGSEAQRQKHLRLWKEAGE